MTNPNQRGSEWRKWDLHVHTPASYDWDRKCTDNAKQIVNAALEHKISAIALSDHHTVQGIDEVRKYADGKLLILPGVEIRTDKGNKGVHIIAIFSPATKSKFIYDKLLCPLGFSEADIKLKGNENIYCSFEKACALIHELGGLVTLHAGTKANGIEQLDSDVRSALKMDLASLVDIFEVNSEKQAVDYEKIVFPKIKNHFPCVTTSDAVDRKKLKYTGGHSTEAIGKGFAWIKADLTFEGLRQILFEPKGRVFIGTEPPKTSNVEGNKSKFALKIKIYSTTEDKPSWFDSEIPLNSGLVAVIGKKGSGKSAFVDALGICGQSHLKPQDYSFLSPTKFKKNSSSKKYAGNLSWADMSSSTMNLAAEVEKTAVERVKYLPQKFVEEICNENGVSTLFQGEINKVIFSYVPEEERYGASSLEELLTVKTDNINNTIDGIRVELRKEVKNICELESKASGDYKKNLENKLAEKQKEFKNLKDPKKIHEPKGTLPKAVKEGLEKIRKSIDELENQITKAKEESKGVLLNLASIEKIIRRLEEVRQKKESFFDELKAEAKAIGVDLEELIKLEINDVELNAKKNELEKRKEQLSRTIERNNPSSKTSLYIKKQKLEVERDAITKSMDSQGKEYQEYLKQLKVIKDKRADIQGKAGDKSLETITSITEELEYLKSNLKKDIHDGSEKVLGLLSKLHKEIQGKVSLYKEIYKPVVDFIESENDNPDNKLTFNAGIIFNRSLFTELFLNFINQTKEGSFQRKDSGGRLLKEITQKYDLVTSEATVKFAKDIIEHLRFDKTKTPPEENLIERQLNSKYTKEDVYNFLTQLSYLDVRFKILFNGKDLNENEFSPGEKGALLLIFYLFIDQENVPLIMDQPEENLDNESVYLLLVPYIKRAKNRRQIIIVTHNPNLAVVCDAEQIVVATMNKQTNEIRYFAGSIENPEINKNIVDILEGTMPAFINREKKYFK